MNGLTKVAPALAARIACAAEKHSVTLTIAPSSVRRRQARSPSGVSGTFTVMFLAMPRSTRASAIMPSNSVAATSALTGPGTVAQISASTSWNFFPVLAISEGLVVTPSSKPAGGERLDLRGVGGIDEELHAIAPICGYGSYRMQGQGRKEPYRDSETHPPPHTEGAGERAVQSPNPSRRGACRSCCPIRFPGRSTIACRRTWIRNPATWCWCR